MKISSMESGAINTLNFYCLFEHDPKINTKLKDLLILPEIVIKNQKLQEVSYSKQVLRFCTSKVGDTVKRPNAMPRRIYAFSKPHYA